MKLTQPIVAVGILIASLTFSVTGFANNSNLPNDGVQDGVEKGVPNGIVWYGVLTDGIAEAKATGKPIMFLSAAPQCTGVPGVW
jgi:hypothetical protein